MLPLHTIIAHGPWPDPRTNHPTTRTVVGHPYRSPPALSAATGSDPSPVACATDKTRCDPSTESSPYPASGCRNKTDSRKTDRDRACRQPGLTDYRWTCAYRLTRPQDILVLTCQGKTLPTLQQGQQSIQCCHGKVLADGNR